LLFGGLIQPNFGKPVYDSVDLSGHDVRAEPTSSRNEQQKKQNDDINSPCPASGERPAYSAKQ
jgi:hypothetical protein